MALYLLATILIACVTLSTAADHYERSNGRGYKQPYYSQPQTYPVPMPYPVQQASSGCGGCGCCNGRRRRDADQDEVTPANKHGEQDSLPPPGFVQMVYPNGANVLVPIVDSPNNQSPQQESTTDGNVN